MLYLLVVAFILSLAVALGASVWFTRSLEVLSDHFHFSPGLLSLLGALGANIPNYIASLTAAIDGQAGLGIGIIIGSNIYNVAIILGVSTFAAPAARGIVLAQKEARDARLVGVIALAMMLTTALAVAALAWRDSLPVSSPALLPGTLALSMLNLLTLGCFGALSFHALQRKPDLSIPTNGEAEASSAGFDKTAYTRRRMLSVTGEVIGALGIALGAVVAVVQTGEAVATDIHLPAAVLSLIILAVATSLPNTVVAFTLAHAGRASASVEEVLSSNSVNVALGVALPLLFWSGARDIRSLVFLDSPLMVVLTLIAWLCVRRQRISHLIGWLLMLTYIGWVAVHLFLR